MTLLYLIINAVFCLFFIAIIYAQAEGWRGNLAIAVFNAFMCGVLLVIYLMERRYK